MQLAKGHIPRGYDHLTKKQKKLARKIVNGMTISDACKCLRMSPDTYYRYMHYHAKFKAYYLRYAEKTANQVEGRLDAKLGRAVRVVENALDSPDDYFAHESAVKFLTGRGFYKRSLDSKKSISKDVKFSGKVTHIAKVEDKELMKAFVQALGAMTSGGIAIQPKIVKAKVVNKVINALPEPAPNASLDSQVQEIEQAKAS
jgi:hypothetical protein